jgi:WD40 repeat protein
MVEQLAFSPDGSLLATFDEPGDLRLWEPATGRVRRRLEGDTGRVTALAFSPDSSLLATIGEDGAIRLWDPASGRAVSGFVLGSCHALAWSVAGVAVSVGGRLVMLDVIERRPSSPNNHPTAER